MKKIRSRTENIMRIAKILMEMRVEAIPGEQSLGVNGWLDYYCYEPIADVLSAMRDDVLPVLRAIMLDDEKDWEWRIFAQDGFVEFCSSGEKVGEEDAAMPGTCAISEYLESINGTVAKW